jgi:catalase
VITGLVADQATDCEQLSFNPTRLVPGIDCSDDPILLARRDAYAVSFEMRRTGGCPVL